MVKKRVDALLKPIIALAQARKWTLDSFIVKVRQLWGNTPDVIADRKRNYLRAKNSSRYEGEVYPHRDLDD